MKKQSHCSYCGNLFPLSTPWPRLCPACGNTTYRNPLPVAVILLPVAGGLVVVRRNIEPRKGTLTFPGGYVDCGETWQEAACRELLEETGIVAEASGISLYDVRNGLDDTLVIFGLAPKQPMRVLKPFSSAETQEVSLIHQPTKLGFPLHTEISRRYFSELRS